MEDRLKVNETIPINDKTSYFIHPHHRMNVPLKSTWAMPPQVEVAMFQVTLANAWFQDDEGWGLRVANNKLEQTGLCPEGKPVFLAKFVGDTGSTPNLWHGYPANIRVKREDIPPKSLLNGWHSSGVIDEKILMMIVRRQA